MTATRMMSSFSYCLTRIYAYLPTWLGGFEGATNEFICSQLTNIAEDHWKALVNREICDDLITRKFLSKCFGIVICVVFISIISCSYNVVQILTHYSLRKFSQ